MIAALAAVLLVTGGAPGPAGAAEATGRLVVEIASRRPDGEPFLRRGNTVWVYYSGAADRHVKEKYGHGFWSGYITRHLLARRDVGDQPPAVLAPVTRTLPAGKYYVSLVAASGIVAAPFMQGCGTHVTITAERETRVRFPYVWRDSTSATRQCTWDRHDWAQAASAASDRNPWLDAWDEVKGLQQDCARRAAPMLELRQRVAAHPPSVPAVALFTWDGDQREAVAGDGEQEIDGAQIRLIVEALKVRCWSDVYGRRGWYLPAATTNDERQLEASIHTLVRAELRKLAQIDTIATILEDVERRQPRR